MAAGRVSGADNLHDGLPDTFDNAARRACQAWLTMKASALHRNTDTVKHVK
jgi:hypothetical protein